jgi:hypothetical protein
MSKNLVAFIHEFLNKPYDGSEFCDQYIRLWREEGRSGELLTGCPKTLRNRIMPRNTISNILFYKEFFWNTI